MCAQAECYIFHVAIQAFRDPEKFFGATGKSEGEHMGRYVALMDMYEFSLSICNTIALSISELKSGLMMQACNLISTVQGGGSKIAGLSPTQQPNGLARTCLKIKHKKTLSQNPSTTERKRASKQPSKQTSRFVIYPCLVL